MLISLEANGEEFAKQVARVRRMLSTFIAANGPASPERDQQACSSRLMAASFVPFLTGLRTELMRLGQEDGATPHQIMTAVADVCANITQSTENTAARRGDRRAPDLGTGGTCCTARARQGADAGPPHADQVPVKTPHSTM